MQTVALVSGLYSTRWFGGAELIPVAPIPDITKDLAPSKWSDAATFFFFSVGGLFLGGETGFLTGTASASRAIAADPGARSRIEKAFRNYQIDAMKQQVNILESQSVPDPLFK